MEKKDWDQFFVLLEKIVNLQMPVNEKTKLVVDMAKRNERDEMNFGEFSTWDFSMYQD